MTMKITLLMSLLMCAVIAAPQNPQDVQILRSSNNNDGLGSYSFDFETSDGTSRQEQAELKNAGTDQEALSVTGSFTWIASDGQQYQVTYIADENGFQPQAPHIV